jgi:hypothetical protein
MTQIEIFIDKLNTLYQEHKQQFIDKKLDVSVICFHIKKELEGEAINILKEWCIRIEKLHRELLITETNIITILVKNKNYLESRLYPIKNSTDKYLEDELEHCSKEFIESLYGTCIFETITQGYISEYNKHLAYFFYKEYYFSSLDKQEQVKLHINALQEELRNKNIQTFFDELYSIEKDMPNKSKTDLETIYEDIRKSLGKEITDVLFGEYCKIQFRLTSNRNTFIEEQVEKQNQFSNKLDMCGKDVNNILSKKEFLDFIQTCFILDLMCQSKQIGSTHELHWELYCQFLSKEYLEKPISQKKEINDLMTKYKQIQQAAREFTEKFVDDVLESCPIQIGVNFWYHIHIRHVADTKIFEKGTPFPEQIKGNLLWHVIKLILSEPKDQYKIVEQKPSVCFGVFLWEQLYIVIIKNKHLYTIYPENAKTEKADRKRKIKEYLKNQKKPKEGYEPTIFINEDNLKEYIK